MYTCKKRFCYSFSLLKYRYEISIVDISTLLKNIDIDIDMVIFENIDIDIDKANLKNIDIDKENLVNIDIDIDKEVLENINIDIDIDKEIFENIRFWHIEQPYLSLKIHTNSLLMAKKGEKHLELDGASQIPQI